MGHLSTLSVDSEHPATDRVDNRCCSDVDVAPASIRAPRIMSPLAPLKQSKKASVT